MVFLTYNIFTFEFSNNILKISTYLEHLSSQREYSEQPLPLLKCSDTLFNTFEGWFKVVERTYIKDNSTHQIFYSQFFKNYDLKYLFDIFNFALSNQIQLLCETIAFVIASKNITIVELDDYYYTSANEPIKVNNEIYLKTYLLNATLVRMVAKYMTERQLEKQPKSIQDVEKIHVVEIYNPNDDF